METLIYINGELVPEREAKISIFDIGFMYSAVFYESLRTFKHKLYRLDDHLERLDRTLRYAGLPSLVSKDEMGRVLEKTIEANIGLFEEEDDCWICGQVTPGNGFPQPLMKGKRGQPTIIAYISPMPYDEYADCYLHGKPAVISRVPNIPNSVVDPRGKTRFRLHYFMAKLETNVRDPEAFALLLDTQGYLTEGTGANVFFASKGTLYTPTTLNILEGISRRTVIELAGDLGIPVCEKDLTLYDAFNADEAFWTTSSYCMLPLSRIGHSQIGENIPGPITRQLLDAWSQKVGVDIVGQAMKYRNRKTNIWRESTETPATSER